MTQGRNPPAAPPIPWKAIKRDWELDPEMTPYRLSNKYGGRPTRQGIAHRIKRDGWTRKNELINLSDLVKNDPEQGSTMPARHKTKNITATIIETYAKSGNYSLTAQAAGIHRDTLRNWRRDNPQLRQAMDQERARELTGYQNSISEAANIDWKAAAYALERAPETRHQYQRDGGGSGGVTVVLNIPREASEGITIDGQAIPEPELD